MTIAAESSSDKSVNSGVICGVVTRMHQEGEEADQRERDGGHRRHSRRTERFHEIEQTLHRACPRGATLCASPGKICPVYG